MRYVAKIAALLLALLMLTGLSDRSFDRVKVLRVRDRALISFPRMIAELSRSRVIIVGESHERPLDHRLELQVITALRKQRVPLAVALEMFSADRQQALDAWVAGGLGLDGFIRIYYDEWRIPWPNYRDLFLYARREKIPLVGLNVPAAIPSKVSRSGFAALTPEERAKLPSGITCTIDQPYQEFITRAYRLHGTREKSFRNFCEAQMLWNKVMAWHLAEYLRRYPQRTVVVITGTGHAMKQAIPAELAGYLAVPVSVVMAEDPELPRRTVSSADADYLVLP